MLFHKKIIFLLLISWQVVGFSEQIKPFKFSRGSYQQLVDSKKNQPFNLIIWSLSCSSCLKEMDELARFSQQHPQINLVMLSTDGDVEAESLQMLLEQKGLGHLQSWQFSGDNPQKLRYEIDASWYGELPRSYFFNRQQQHTAKSGLLTKSDYQLMLNHYKAQ